MKALLIGATGLVGGAILQQLLDDKSFETVSVFGRRTTGVKHAKLTEHIIDFAKISDWKDKVYGDVAFSALGTTRSQAGSHGAQYQVDVTYQSDFARVCAENGVSTFVLISSMSANATSKIPYPRMKGELEEIAKGLGFKKLFILRPGPLEGEREQRRLAEETTLPLARAISHVPFLGFLHPVSGDQVARTAVQVSKHSDPFRILESLEVRLGQF